MKGSKLASVFCFFLLFLTAACNKPDFTDLGNNLIPAIDRVNTFLTVLELDTDNKLLPDTTRMLDGEAHGIGIINNDPEFGKTVATSYISFTPNAPRHPFMTRDTVIIDSVVLSLSFGNIFGDTNGIQQFEVREIDSRFTRFGDSLYPIDAPDFTALDPVIGSSFVHFKDIGADDTAVYKNGKDTIRKSNELRIRLDTSWARRFVNYDTSVYKDDSIFQQNFFAGLQIKPVEGQGSGNAIAYFNLTDNERTRITFYCRIQNNGRTDTLAPHFHHNRDPQANLIRRTPANGYQAALNNSDSNDAVLYIQSTPGSYAEIEIKGLDTLADTNRLVHRAELVLEKYTASQDLFYSAPPLLFLDAVTDDGDSTFFIRNDFVPTTASNPGYDFTLLGGIYRNNQYVFNITRYIQSIITKKLRSYKLRVYAPLYAQNYYLGDNTDQHDGRLRRVFVNTPIGFGRVVLHGGASTDPKRPKLRIIYSRL